MIFAYITKTTMVALSQARFQSLADIIRLTRRAYGTAVNTVDRLSTGGTSPTGQVSVFATVVAENG